MLTTATQDGVSFRLLLLDRKTGGITGDWEIFQQKLTRKEGRNSYATATPATDGERVYVLSFNGSFAAVDFQGKTVWTNTDYSFYSQHGLATSPILHEDLLLAAFDPSSDGDDKELGWKKPWDKAMILALDKRTGKVRWKGSRAASRIAHATPVVYRNGSNAQLISNAGDVIQGFDLKTGERLWSLYAQGEGVVPSPVTGEGMVFTASGFEKPTILGIRLGETPGKAEIAWENKKSVPMVPSFVYRKPWLFTINDGGSMMCLEAATGKVIWQEKLPATQSASPVLADGKLYLLADDGSTSVVEAGASYRFLAKNELNEKCQAAPAISDGQIFIRTEKNLYCIGQVK